MRSRRFYLPLVFSSAILAAAGIQILKFQHTSTSNPKPVSPSTVGTVGDPRALAKLIQFVEDALKNVPNSGVLDDLNCHGRVLEVPLGDGHHWFMTGKGIGKKEGLFLN